MGRRFDVEEVVSKRGGAGGAGDDSDNLADMKFAEKLVLDVEMLEELGKREVLTDSNRKGYKFITVKIESLKEEEMGYEASDMSSAAQRINAVFVAIGLVHPRFAYRAQPYNSDEAETKEIIVSRGKKKGQTETRTLSDKIKIFRTGETFDATKYGIPESGKTWKANNEPLDYEQATPGVTARVARWIFENRDANAEVFNAAGIDTTNGEGGEGTEEVEGTEE